MHQIVLELADPEDVQTSSGGLELSAEVEEAHLPLLDGGGGCRGRRRRGRGEGDQGGTLGGNGGLEGVQGGREGQRYLKGGGGCNKSSKSVVARTGMDEINQIEK